MAMSRSRTNSSKVVTGTVISLDSTCRYSDGRRNPENPPFIGSAAWKVACPDSDDTALSTTVALRKRLSRRFHRSFASSDGDGSNA